MNIVIKADHSVLRWALRVAGILNYKLMWSYEPGGKFYLLLGPEAFNEFAPGELFSHWRGSIYVRKDGVRGMVTWGVDHVLQMADDFPLWLLDLKRAWAHYKNPRALPEIQVHVRPDPGMFQQYVDEVRAKQLPVAFDLEGYPGDIRCIAFSAHLWESWVIPWEEPWIRIARDLLEDDAVPKVGHNVNYDRYVLAREGIVVGNIINDTMIAHWALYPGTRKDLGTLAKLYADVPPYKHTMQENLEEYCGKDAAATLAVHISQRTLGIPGYCRRIVSLMDAFLWMSLKGWRLDIDGLQNEIETSYARLGELQARVDRAAGRHINPQSVKQVRQVLGLNSTTYEDLLRVLYKDPENELLRAIVEFRVERKRLSILKSIRPDVDGRCRCAYNVVGTYTGRTSCSEAPGGVGTNLQTIPKDLRRLFVADEGFHVAQCDLSGADGWTVAARAASLGDPTMLEDYLHGLKPARIIGVWHLHGPITDRAQLKALSKQVPEDLYFACKRIQHGSNYMMGPITLSRQIFVDSEGKVRLTTAEAEKLQQLYFTRYPGVKYWHEWVQHLLKRNMPLEAASGHKHRFWLNREAVLTKALAFEPQHNTTWATNMALSRMPVSDRLWPCHHVHDALVFQFMDTDVLEQVKQWFQNPLVIGKVEVIIPFEGGWGPSWGETNHGIPA